MRIRVKMPDANGGAAGTTATFQLPIGRRFHNLFLRYAGVTLAQMPEYRVSVNGEVIHRLSMVRRDTINKWDGRGGAAGMIVIPFDRFNLYEQRGEESTAIQTGSPDKNGVSISTFKLEVDIDAAAAAPALSLYAEQSDNDPAMPGPGRVLCRVLTFPYANLPAGISEISQDPKATEGPKWLVLNRKFFFSANLTEHVIERSNTVIWNTNRADANQLATDGVRVPQAGMYAADPSDQGYDYEGFGLVQPNGQPHQDFRHRITLSAAETISSVNEYFGTLGG